MTGDGVPRSWTLDLPFEKPLSTNEVYGHHWAVVKRKVDPWKEAVGWLLTQQKIPRLDRFTVVLHFAPKTKRGQQRDLDNLHATLKPCVDTLKKFGVCIDDNAAHYTPSAPVIHSATGKPGRLWLVITDLTTREGPRVPGPSGPG